MENTILNDPGFILITMALAAFRIYLEIIGLRFEQLPISRSMGKERAQKFHRAGLFLSIGYIALFAPGVLLGNVVFN